MSYHRLSMILKLAGVISIAAVVLPLTASSSSVNQDTYNLTLPNGGNPLADVILDVKGHVYGTTQYGGPAGDGTVFELTPQGNGQAKETVLYSFTGGGDGGQPMAGVVFDAEGSLYGTTEFGGDNVDCANKSGCGVVFRLTPDGNGQWTESVLYSFTGNADGGYPLAGLVLDSNANLYGTTVGGGISNPAACGGPLGCGVAFELTPTSSGEWTEAVLYSFTGNQDAFTPQAAVTIGSDGNLFGTTVSGGIYGLGTVFRLTPNGGGQWTESLVYSFASGSDGWSPSGGVIFDKAGNLYGTTLAGGNTGCYAKQGCGVVFELTPTSQGEWSETVLRYFFNGKLGGAPSGGVVFDHAGNLYGATRGGGGPDGIGVVFRLQPRVGQVWTERAYALTEGREAYGGVILGRSGDIYGTTFDGGTGGVGIVFRLSRSDFDN